MKTINTFVAEARKTLDIAEHLLTKTFLLAQDPKVLLSVLAHIKRAHNAMVHALLETCQQDSKDNFELDILTIKKCLKDKHIIEQTDLEVLIDVHTTALNYKHSPVAFARKKDLIVSKDEQYDLESITAEKLSQQLALTNELIYKFFGRSTGT